MVVSWPVRCVMVCVLLLTACAGGPEPAPEPDYDTVPGLADVPLMPGLQAEAGGPKVRMTSEGRVMEAFAKGVADRYTVVRFYHRALPRLGWTSQSQRDFVRNGEKLRITVTGQDGAVRVRFVRSVP